MTSTSFRRMLRHTPMRDLVRGRVTGRLDIERMLKESSLSEAAASKVRNVVKRTRLWRLEKVDVARELIAHFADGQAAGTPTEELLETFGDERQVAKLIRRAKKRQSPMPWHVFAWARLCLLTFFGVYVLAALYLAAGSPSVTTDYMAKLNAKAADVPAKEAAWPIYREALHEMGYSQHAGKHGFTIKESARPGDQGWPEKLAFIQEHTDNLRDVRRAASLPRLGYRVRFDTAPGDEVIFEPSDMSGYTYKGPHPPLIGALLPHLGPMRALTRLLSADTLRAAEAGEGETAQANIIAMLGIARQADEHALLINGLVRLSLQKLAYRRVQDVLIQTPELWSDDQLRTVAHSIAAIETTPEDWYNSERLWFYDYLQRAYTDDGHGGGHITSQGLDDSAMYDSGGLISTPPSATRSVVIAAGLPIASVLIAPREDMRAMYDSLMDQAIVDSRKPLWLDDNTQTVEQRVQRMQASTREGIRYSPIIIFFPSITAVSRTLQTQEGYRDGVLVGIALELYRREHGDWPDALSALSPTYLPSIPVDRLTGAPVKYQVKDAGPVVYSVGVDGDDDGGRPPVERDGDIVNEMASPKQFTGEPRSEDPHDGDWLLWPVPNED